MRAGPCYKVKLASMTYTTMNAVIRTVSIVFFCLPLLTPLGAAAQQGIGDDVFTVREVPVDVTASTAARARDVAIRRAQRQASKQVLARITLPEDKRKLPVLDDTRIARLVSSIRFSEERYSSKRYIANITIAFNRKSVLDLVRLSGISFSQTQARPIVVVPIYRDGETELLWEPGNPWREAWRSHEWRGNLLPFVVPNGSLGDVAAINARQATAREPDRIAAIADRYNAGETLVADAAMRYDAEGAAEALDVTVMRYGQSDEQGVNVTFLRDKKEDLGEFLAWCAAQIADRLTLEWKRQTLIEFDAQKTLIARAPLRSLKDWLNLQAALGDVGRIRGYVLESLAVEEAVVTIDFLGAPEQLATALAQQGVNLIGTEEDWILSIQ